MQRVLTLLILVLTICAHAQSRDIDSLEARITDSENQEDALCDKAVLVTRYFTGGQGEKSFQLLAEAVKEAELLQSDKAWGAIFNAKGTLFFYQTILDSALHYYKKSTYFRKKANDLEGAAKALSNIGNIYSMTGDFAKAQKFYEAALKQEAELGLEEGALVPLNNIAVMNRRLNIPRKAIQYFLKAEKVYLKSGALNRLSTTYDGLSRVYSDLRKKDSALLYAGKSMELATRAGDIQGTAYALQNMASIFSMLQKYDSAIVYLKAAIPYARMVRNLRLEVASLANITVSFIQKGELDSALKYVELLIPLQETLGYNNYERELAKIYAAFYYSKNEPKKAYDHLMRFALLQDSMYQIAMNGKILEMQEKYESDKKQKENLLLQAENRQYKTTRNYLLLILSLAVISIIGGIFAFARIRRANKIIYQQKELVEEKQKEILDSINYARRIQFALLSSNKLLENNLTEHFVMFKPKAVVSGDFYWASATDDAFLLMAGDCTGHGVPGAFMSLLNITKLSQVVNEHKITQPAQILDRVRSEIIQVLNPAGAGEDTKDGMDAVLCKFRRTEKKLEYAAANNVLYIVRNKKLIVCPADKMPVGRGHDDQRPFSNHEIDLLENDMIYMLTDGFADQFGGPLGKKFKYKQLEALLIAVSTEPLEKQHLMLENTFEDWRGSQEQVDDVCLIGVRV